MFFSNVLIYIYIVTMGKLLEMFSEIASSPATCFWFITCAVRLPVVLLLNIVRCSPVPRHLTCTTSSCSDDYVSTTNNVTRLLAISLHISSDFTQGIVAIPSCNVYFVKYVPKYNIK